MLLSLHPFYSEVIKDRPKLSANGYDLRVKTKQTLFDFYISVPDIKQEPSSPVQDPEEAGQQSGGWGRGGEGEEVRGKGDCLYEGRQGQRQTFKQDNRHQLRFATSVLS